MEVYREVADLIEANGSGVLLTLVSTDGSTPQKAGARMLVLADGSVRGSIGGGSFEKEMRTLALTLLVEGTSRLVTVGAADDDGSDVCGGKKMVFLEPITGGEQIVIIGNGHVGQAVAKIASGCGWQVRIRDDRPPLNATEGKFVQLLDYQSPLTGLTVGREEFILIATRSHATDLQALRAVLTTSAGFVGLLGGHRKKETFFSTLRAEGVGEEELQRVVCPVGLNIGAKSPAEIAVSIMAQVIQVSEKA